jgi:hypothetical protein
MSYNDNILLIATVVMWWAGAVFAAMVNNFSAASLFVGNAALYAFLLPKLRSREEQLGGTGPQPSPLMPMKMT